jgi:hypothetical protein
VKFSCIIIKHPFNLLTVLFQMVCCQTILISNMRHTRRVKKNTRLWNSDIFVLLNLQWNIILLANTRFGASFGASFPFARGIMVCCTKPFPNVGGVALFFISPELDLQHYSCEWIRIRHSTQNFGFLEYTVRNSIQIRPLPKYNACTYISDVSSGGR